MPALLPACSAAAAGARPCAADQRALRAVGTAGSAPPTAASGARFRPVGSLTAQSSRPVLHAVHGVALARRVRRLPLHVRLGFRPAAVSASQPAQPEPPAGAPLPPTPSPQWLVHILQPLGWWAASSVALAVLLNQPAFRIWWLATSAEWLQWNVVVPITVPLVVGLVLRVWSYGDSFASSKADAAEREQRSKADLASIKADVLAAMASSKADAAEREQRSKADLASIKAEAAEREQRSKADWASFKADVLAAMSSSKADAAEREQRSKADAAERELRTKSDSRERERRVVEWTKAAASANTAAAAQVMQSAAQASAAAAQAIAAAAQASAASTPSPSAEVSW